MPGRIEQWWCKLGEKTDRSRQQNPRCFDALRGHKSCLVVILTKDIVEEVHEDQHRTHQADKEDHFERRVKEKLFAVCFALSPSCNIIDPVPATNRKTVGGLCGYYQTICFYVYLLYLYQNAQIQLCIEGWNISPLAFPAPVAAQDDRANCNQQHDRNAWINLWVRWSIKLHLHIFTKHLRKHTEIKYLMSNFASIWTFFVK